MFVLDAYAARSCPVKTHHQFHPGFTEPEPTTERLRFPAAAEFADRVLAAILSAAGDRAFDARGLHEAPSAEQEQACLDAMDAGRDVIVEGLLPRDWAGHRSGRPSLLIRDPESGGYLPAAVKYQRVLDVRRDEAPFDYSTLTDPTRRLQRTGFRFKWQLRVNLALQLAHYWRMLEAIGRAAPGEPRAAAVGTDPIEPEGEVLTWISLVEPLITPGALLGRPAGADGDPVTPASPVSALTRYDAEFGWRVRIAEEAAGRSAGDPPALFPVITRECGWCRWWPVCRDLVDEDDLSLRISKSPLDLHEMTALRTLDLGTVSSLAAADLDAVLPGYLPQVGHRAGAEERLRLAQRRSRLLLEGIELDRVTSGPIELPEAEVEIDLDIETSRGDRVYLWGFLLHDTSTGRRELRQFAAFTDLDDAAELALAREALTWLRDAVAERDSLVFHYSDYEVTKIDKIGRAADPVLAWASAFARERFVDLFTPVRQHFFGANGLGLKAVAGQGPRFTWRDDSPGGLNSMSWFEDAVRAETAVARELARTRVLEYNEDDVRATWHVRRWLRAQG